MTHLKKKKNMKIVSSMEMEDILSFENLVNLFKTVTLNPYPTNVENRVSS